MKQLTVIMLGLALIAGCEMNNTAARDAKREQDRMAMRLADAERERDSYKSQIDSMQANVNQANQKLTQAQSDLQNSNTSLAQTQRDLATAKNAGNQVDALRAQLDQAQSQIRELQNQVKVLKDRLEQTPRAGGCQQVNRVSSRSAGVLLLIAASVLWSLSGVFIKIVGIEPVLFAFWRALAAGLVVLPMIRFSSLRIPRSRWMLLSILVCAGVEGLVITAMTRATAASGILLQYTGPAFCALLAWFVLKRRISSRTWAAIVIALLGVGIMVVGGNTSHDWIGPTCGILSGVAFGGFILILEKLDQGGGSNPFAIVAFNNLGCALLFFLPIALWLNGSLRARPWQIGLVLLCGAVQLGIPYVLFQLGLRRVSAVEASLLILLEPVLNPIWVWLAMGEMPDLATFIGGAAIIFAMVLEARAPKPR